MNGGEPLPISIRFIFISLYKLEPNLKSAMCSEDTQTRRPRIVPGLWPTRSDAVTIQSRSVTGGQLLHQRRQDPGIFLRARYILNVHRPLNYDSAYSTNFTADELSLLFTGHKTSLADRPTETTEAPETPDQVSDLDEPTALDPTSPCLSQHNPPETPSDTPATPPPNQPPIIHPNLLTPFPNCPQHPLFITEQLGIDRRLIVNRKRQLKMYRVWMQGKFRKLPP